MYAWPTKKQLMDATVEVLSKSNEIMSASSINDEVALLLQLPDELLKEEDANCTGTAFSYKMRWARTELKQKGIIANPKRGYWVLV